MTTTQVQESTSDAAPAARRAPAYEYSFPAIRGVQARREFYVTMFPLRLIPRLFLFDEEELQPTLRAQRTLNRARVPEIARYILDNPDGYVFSALTASVDAEIHFEALATEGPEGRIGLLTIPMSARFVINDGQHRRAAIEQALRENPEIGDESIPVVLFLDVGLERCQQMFTDLNRYAIRPARSLTILYDQREDAAQIARLVVYRSPRWQNLVEMEKSNLSPRSRKLFTLSALYTATKTLLEGLDGLESEEAADIAIAYWNAVFDLFPEWQQVYDRKVTAGDIRRDFLHSHGIVLHALGRTGNTLLRESRKPRDWLKSLAGLKEIDWSRSNTALWEGRALIGGRVSKSSTNVVLTTNVIRHALGMSLGPEEQRIEDAYMRGDT
ncbi:DNA sulfur modification protein DndB [Haloechinothrix halophila]|uniref:DNA sulfur modification protein DndB n=1 Tax=Haloechinothrix halophila TaxID=1069073 RepID=UPI000A0767A9|nr:DNA sulfur modification protein DndB [Haloechinothrix halophila]